MGNGKITNDHLKELCDARDDFQKTVQEKKGHGASEVVIKKIETNIEELETEIADKLTQKLANHKAKSIQTMKG